MNVGERSATGQRMRALSLWQPWASLIALGFKTFETRSWKTPYRGRVAIHATKIEQLTPALNRLLRAQGELPLGAIVATAELVEVHPVEDVRGMLPALELELGNYADGRYAWRLAHVRALSNPIPARGAQGLWWWTAPKGTVL